LAKKWALWWLFCQTRSALKNGSVPTARGGTSFLFPGVYQPDAPMGQIIWLGGFRGDFTIDNAIVLLINTPQSIFKYAPSGQQVGSTRVPSQIIIAL